MAKLAPIVLRDEIEARIDPTTGNSDINVAADFMRPLDRRPR